MMNTHVILLRGINVGGKNILPMAGLKKRLQELGFADVSTYIASGNVILASDRPADEVKARIEAALAKGFKPGGEPIRVLVLSRKQLQAIVDHKPKGFGDEPGKYHSDAIFLMGISAAQAMPVFKPREGVDKVWPGDGVIYSQRLSAERTRSRLSKIMASPFYKSMTVRNWNTTTRLLDLLKGADTGKGPNRRH
jgi:uncharacterized protein (DUF1697 family)